MSNKSATCTLKVWDGEEWVALFPKTKASQIQLKNGESQLEEELAILTEMVSGAQQVGVYENYETLVDTLNEASPDKIRLGMSLYIQTIDVPDLWVCGVSNTCELYLYTTDDEIVKALENNGTLQIGYYKVAQLEGAKVNTQSGSSGSSVLICNYILEFNDKTYNYLKDKFDNKAELDTNGAAVAWLNRPPSVGERFFAVGVTSDKRSVGFTAEVTRLGEYNGTPYFWYKFADFVLLGEDYPILSYTMGFNNVTLEQLTEYKNGKYTFEGKYIDANTSYAIPVERFNIPPRVGNNFFGTALVSPKGANTRYPSVISYTAKVTNINHQNDVEYTFDDVTVLHKGELDEAIETIPLIVDEVLVLPNPHGSIVIGYKNSIDLESLNKLPQKDERFWGICKSTDNYVYSFVARCTGEITTDDKGVQYAVFEFVEAVLLYSQETHNDVRDLKRRVQNIETGGGSGTGAVPLVINNIVNLGDIKVKVNALVIIDVSDFNRTPINGEFFVMTGYAINGNVYCIRGKVSSVGETSVNCNIATFKLLYDSESLGNIETALDEIIAIQNSLIGTPFDELHEYAQSLKDGGEV